MDKSFTIAVREYLSLVRTKTFLITIIVIPLLSMSSLVIPTIAAKLADKSDKKIIVFTDNQALEAELLAKEKERSPATTRVDNEKLQAEYVFTFAKPNTLNQENKLGLSEKLRDGDLHAFIVHESDGVKDSFRIYMKEALSASFTEWFRSHAQLGLQKQRAMALNIEPKVVEGIMERAVFEVLPPFYASEDGRIINKGAESFQAKALIPIVLVLMMFMTMMFQTTPLVQGIVEEKQRKITEVLLGSVSPIQLMLGKLFGNLGLVLTVMFIYGGCLAVLAIQFDALGHISASLLGWFLVFDILAILLYGSLFLAIGSGCNDLQETQNLLMPVVLMATVPMIIAVSAATEPLGAAGVAISYLPPATPFMFMIRIGTGDPMALWEPLLGVGVLAVTTIITVILSARVFRIGILAGGKAPKAKVLLRWMIRGY